MAAPPADICGPFPILSAPYEEDGALDVETLVREARHAASSGVAGFIWAQSNDTVDLLTVEEKKTSFAALAKAFAGSPVYVTLGCQGRDTSDMETLARHVEELAAAGFDVLGDYGLSQGLVPEARAAKKDGTIFYDYAATCPSAHLKRWTEIRQASAPYIPGVSAGRDASPRCRLDEPFPWKTIAYPYDGIATNNTPEAFGRILKTAQETTLADPKKPAAVLIYGWNEYTEGGYIAPTRLNGDGHLRAVEKVFGRNLEGSRTGL